MSAFLEYVFWLLQRSLILVLLVGMAASAVLAVIYLIHKRKYKGTKRFPWGKAALWLLFAAYLAVVIYATMLRWDGFFHREWNLHLFRAWREAWNNFSTKNWANVLLNIAMFGPLGFLLPLMGKCFHRWYVTLPVGFFSSLAIELLQLALGRGICDVDDLFCNALGAAMGYFAIMAILALFHDRGKRIKPTLTYVCLTLVPLAAIGSIFVCYHLQEYGNLPEAAAYSVNLDHLKWTVDCDLPDSSGNVPVYRTQTMRKADCDAFAEKIAGLIREQVDMVSYYQEMAYYNLTNGIVMVYYHDGSYEFRAFGLPFAVGPQPDRESLEAALEAYALIIPEAAEFKAEEDGWYSFTCDRHIDGALMMDGTLRVRNEITDDYTQLSIENHLIQYSRYQDAAIISPEEACQELVNGNFLYADSLKHYAGDSVTIVSCTLDYSIDTKGFYQPVYLFHVTYGPGGDIMEIMIPAMQ